MSYAAGGLDLPQLASMKLGGGAGQKCLLGIWPAAPPGRSGQPSMPLGQSLVYAAFRAENGVRLLFLASMVPSSDRMHSILIETILCGSGRKTTAFTGF